MARRSHAIVVVALVSLFFAAPADAHDGASAILSDPHFTQMQSQVRRLEERVRELEAKLAKLESRDPPAPAAEAIDGRRVAWQQRARARMARDRQTHSADQLAEAERLYQTANQNWRSPEAKAALEQMIAKFPDVNRTGCALVYLGQFAEGEAKETHLKAAIEHHADSFYGDGVQVGPYAKLLLAHHYIETDRRAEAEPLIASLKTEHADAIDHRGRLLVEQLPQ